MARNVERDAKAEERRRKNILKAGFDLFSRCGIESVSMQAVANAAGVGAATMYTYYQNKVNLVIAISTSVWSDVWHGCVEKMGMEGLKELNAVQLIELYDDIMIGLYKERPEVLCFSSNYKTFIRREGASDELLSLQLEMLKPAEDLFRVRYQEAVANGSIRGDIPEREMFTTLSMTMLSMAERYAQGIVWADDNSCDYTNELLNVKAMLLNWVKG